LRIALKLEVDNTPKNAPQTLFRGNSFATKLFKNYTKFIALPYLFQMLAPIIYEIVSTADNGDSVRTGMENQSVDDKVEEGLLADSRTSKRHSLKLDTTVKHSFNVNVELDPQKMINEDDVEVNTYSLLLYCQRILVAILKSAPICPSELRSFFKEVKDYVEPKFPGSWEKAIGGFLFLRLLCSAITVPDSYGLTKDIPSPNARRNLVLVAKVLQNLANNVLFGDKETYMTKLNDFISTNIPKLSIFYDQLLSIQTTSIVETPKIHQTVKTNSLLTVHNHIILFQKKFQTQLQDSDDSRLQKMYKEIWAAIMEVNEGQAVKKNRKA